jgi:hypothetical protein
MSSELNIESIIKRVSEDPYTEHVVHGGLHPSNISRIVSDLFWSSKYNFKNITLEIKKEEDDHHISVKVLERE